MPVFDYAEELTVDGGQAITGTAFTAASKALDAGPGMPAGPTPTRDWGVGDSGRLWAKVSQSFNNLTSLDIQIVGADDTAGSGFVVYLTSNFLLAALSVLGAFLPLGILTPGKTRKRYLLGRFVVNGTAPSAGKLKWKVRPRAFRRPRARPAPGGASSWLVTRRGFARWRLRSRSPLSPSRCQRAQSSTPATLRLTCSST